MKQKKFQNFMFQVFEDFMAEKVKSTTEEDKKAGQALEVPNT